VSAETEMLSRTAPQRFPAIPPKALASCRRGRDGLRRPPHRDRLDATCRPLEGFQDRSPPGFLLFDFRNQRVRSAAHQLELAAIVSRRTPPRCTGSPAHVVTMMQRVRSLPGTWEPGDQIRVRSKTIKPLIGGHIYDVLNMSLVVRWRRVA
jgi:hypothetical protein